MNEFLSSDLDMDLTGTETPKKIQPIGEIRKLLQPIEGTDDFILDVDWSTFSGYLTCPRQGEFSMLFSRNDGGSAALTYGRAIHRGLERIYHARAANCAIDWSSIISDIHREYEGIAYGAEWRTPERALDTLTEYVEKYGNEAYSVLSIGEGTPFIEKPFSYTLCKVPVNATLPYTHDQIVKTHAGNLDKVFVRDLFINWTGVLDLALVSADGNVWPVDHKTTSMAGPAYYRSFALSGQFVGYCAAFRELLGIVPTGMIGNFIIGRKPTVKGKGKTLEFERQLYQYPEWQLDQWKVDMIHHIEKFVQDLRVGYFGANPVSCSGKYGLCRYFTTCEAAPEDRLTHLMSDAYVFNVWNPLAD